MAEFTDDTFDAEFVPEEPAAAKWSNRVSRASQFSGIRLLLILAAAMLVAIYYWKDVFITIRSGEVGVLYLKFGGGTQTDRVLGEGLKIIAPWDTMFIYDLRVSETKHTMNVLTSEGLTVALNLSIRCHPELDLVGLLQKNIGPDYREKIVIPEVESALRITLGNFPMRDVYGSQRAVIQEAINQSLEHVEQKFVKIDEVVLREVILPEKVRVTIEDKMSQKEVLESYEFRGTIAKLEAARRLSEADGIKAYNDTINSSLTPSVLKWAGIEATRELAKSPNSKMIIVGTGANGLPLLLGGGDKQQP
jgi:regulator of protease activity HflC (stomatin/prohibitin superfamily)